MAKQARAILKPVTRSDVTAAELRRMAGEPNGAQWAALEGEICQPCVDALRTLTFGGWMPLGRQHASIGVCRLCGGHFRDPESLPPSAGVRP